MIVEKRTLHELRAESQGEEMALTGYASKFNTESSDLGGFREVVMPGAFSRSIREGADVRFLMNHSPDKVMGRTKNGTLKIEEDGVGLKFRCVLPNTQDARDLYTLVKRGDVDACSFAFIAKGQSWEDTKSDNGDMYAVRKLMDVDLQDCSAVTYPAYPATEVSARHLFGTDEMPVEIRAAIKTLEEKRSGDKGIEISSMVQGCAEKAGAHEFSAGEHEQKAAKALEKGNPDTAQVHHDAARAHAVAQDANMRAIIGYASKSPMADIRAKYAATMSAVATDRSIIANAKRAAKDGSESRAAGTGLPLPYAISMPQPFDSDMKQEWWDAFMDAYKDAVKKQKMFGQEAIAYATACANQEVQPESEVTPEVSGQGKDSSKVPHEVVPTSQNQGKLDESKLARALITGELRYSEGTLEDSIADVNEALGKKYGMCKSTNMWPGCPKYTAVETYPDHVIVRDNDDNDNCFYDIPYTVNEVAGDDEDEITLGEMTKMEQQYVPAERSLAIAESRVYKTPSEKPGSADTEAEKKRKKEGDPNTTLAPSGVPEIIADGNGEDEKTVNKKKKEGRDDGRVAAVSDPDSPDYDPDDPDYDPEYDEERKKTKAENPDGKVKDTKDDARSIEDESILAALRAQARVIEISLE